MEEKTICIFCGEKATNGFIFSSAFRGVYLSFCDDCPETYTIRELQEKGEEILEKSYEENLKEEN